MKTHQLTRRPPGFSLFEVMMFIGIIGVLVGIVLPSALTSDDFKTTKNRRNAQELASVCTCAQVAGLNFVIEDDLLATIRNIRLGGSPADGSFLGRKFCVSGLDDADVEATAKHLEIENGSLIYRLSKKS